MLFDFLLFILYCSLLSYIYHIKALVNIVDWSRYRLSVLTTIDLSSIRYRPETHLAILKNGRACLKSTDMWEFFSDFSQVGVFCLGITWFFPSIKWSSVAKYKQWRNTLSHRIKSLHLNICTLKTTFIYCNKSSSELNKSNKPTYLFK